MIVFIAFTSVDIAEELAQVAVVGLVVKAQCPNVVEVSREFLWVSLRKAGLEVSPTDVEKRKVDTCTDLHPNLDMYNELRLYSAGGTRWTRQS